MAVKQRVVQVGQLWTRTPPASDDEKMATSEYEEYSSELSEPDSSTSSSADESSTPDTEMYDSDTEETECAEEEYHDFQVGHSLPLIPSRSD